MKIALIGYGKMGKAIERLSQGNHEVALKIGSRNPEALTIENLQQCDVAIEFSRPATAFKNIKTCLQAGIPVISGTTGWLAQLDEIHKLCDQLKGSFFYASNFSVGVNLFFELNEKLAAMMSRFPQYKIDLEEIHHIHKLDAPSGTAISIAEGIIDNHPGYNNWTLETEADAQRIFINAQREGEIPGTHLAHYSSDLDKITIRHEAFTRDSFAQGALIAAEWILDKQGIFTMKDLMQT